MIFVSIVSFLKYKEKIWALALRFPFSRENCRLRKNLKPGLFLFDPYF